MSENWMQTSVPRSYCEYAILECSNNTHPNTASYSSFPAMKNKSQMTMKEEIQREQRHILTWCWVSDSRSSRDYTWMHDGEPGFSINVLC